MNIDRSRTNRVALAALVVIAGACHRSTESSPLSASSSAGAGGASGVPSSAMPWPSSSAVSTVALEKRTPSGFLLIGKERLAEVRAKAKGSTPQWDALKANVEEAIKTFDHDRSGPENVALAYLVAGDKRYSDAAFKWFQNNAKTQDVRRDSYLDFGNLMESAALVLNWCDAALAPEQKKEITDYLEKWTNELWFANKGSGWGLADAGNNYHHAFLEGTAYAAYTLQAAGIPSAQKYIDLLREKIERADGVLSYLNGRGKGGDWQEGANYGQRSKQRLFSTFAAIVSMGGPNYFARSSFTSEAIIYAIYQAQPGKQFLAPNGDLARESSMAITPFDRDYMQLATYYTDDPKARGLGAWYLTHVAPSYMMPSMRLRMTLYRDVLYPTPATVTPPTTLPLGYRSPGTEWLNARSSWDDGATSLTVVATPQVNQSHSHIDAGSFVIWRGGWQAVDSVSYGHSGLNWSADAHNMIHVAGHQRHAGKSRGLVQYVDDAGGFYAQVDASNLFTTRVGTGASDSMLDEWTRELVYVRPDTLVVYDRVAPKPAGKDYSWRLHFANKPTGGSGRYGATNGTGAIALLVLDGGAQKIAEDDDLADGPTTAFRVELAPNPTGRFLALVQVANGAPPALAGELISGGGVEGAAWADQVVVFSTSPLGRPATLPFTYKFKDGGKRQHTLANMTGGVDVNITRADGFVTVRVSAGSQYRATDRGLVRFPG